MPAISFNTILDTGFNGEIVLPRPIAEGLGLRRVASGPGILADGTSRSIEVFSVEVEWDGEWRYALVSVIGDEPMIGMRLLLGYELRIQVAPGGDVRIERMPNQ